MTHWILIAILFNGRAGLSATFDDQQACEAQRSSVAAAADSAKVWCVASRTIPYSGKQWFPSIAIAPGWHGSENTLIALSPQPPNGKDHFETKQECEDAWNKSPLSTQSDITHRCEFSNGGLEP